MFINKPLILGVGDWCLKKFKILKHHPFIVSKKNLISNFIILKNFVELNLSNFFNRQLSNKNLSSFFYTQKLKLCSSFF